MNREPRVPEVRRAQGAGSGRDAAVLMTRRGAAGPCGAANGGLPALAGRGLMNSPGWTGRAYRERRRKRGWSGGRARADEAAPRGRAEPGTGGAGRTTSERRAWMPAASGRLIGTGPPAAAPPYENATDGISVAPPQVVLAGKRVHEHPVDLEVHLAQHAR